MLSWTPDQMTGIGKPARHISSACPWAPLKVLFLKTETVSLHTFHWTRFLAAYQTEQGVSSQVKHEKWEKRFISFQRRRVDWRDEDTQIVNTQLSLASLTCSHYIRKLQTASLKQPLPFPSLQAWGRAGHTHLTVLPLLQWELGSAIIKIQENPIITKAYGPHWAGCEKSTTNLTRQAVGNTGRQNYKRNSRGSKTKKNTTEGKTKHCQSLGMTSRKNALVRIMVGVCWDIPRGSSKTLSGMSLVLTTQPICLYSDEYLQLTHSPAKDDLLRASPVQQRTAVDNWCCHSHGK